MKKIKLIIIGLAVFFLTVSSVYAETQNIGKPAGGRLRESIYKELNLTPEQQKKLEENRKAQREKTSQLRTAMQEKERALQQALKDPAVTRDKVEPLVNEIKSLQAQLIDQRVSGIFAVKEILTPEQMGKFNQFMEKRKDGKKGQFQEWRKRRKGMGYDQG
jgi:Spy/CpxP family protein refolding chaperone